MTNKQRKELSRNEKKQQIVIVGRKHRRMFVNRDSCRVIGDVQLVYTNKKKKTLTAYVLNA